MAGAVPLLFLVAVVVVATVVAARRAIGGLSAVATERLGAAALGRHGCGASSDWASASWSASARHSRERWVAGSCWPCPCSRSASSPAWSSASCG